MVPDSLETVVFRSYTHALRHPVVIGHVAGWRLPWAVSATQLGAIAATAAVLLATRPLWAHFGGIGNLVVFCLVMAAAGWAVRHWRVEGRSPLRFAAAWLTVLLGPRGGVCNGRPRRPPRAVRGSAVGVVVMEGVPGG